MLANRLAASDNGPGSPVPGGRSAIASPVTFPACVLTGAPRRRRPDHWPPFCTPILPRRRLIVQRHPMGGGRNSPDRHPLCQSIDLVPASASNSVWDRPAIAPPAHSRLHRQSNSDHTGKRYAVLGRNRESWSRPGNCASLPGNAISQELTSLIINIHLYRHCKSG